MPTTDHASLSPPIQLPVSAAPSLDLEALARGDGRPGDEISAAARVLNAVSTCRATRMVVSEESAASSGSTVLRIASAWDPAIETALEFAERLPTLEVDALLADATTWAQGELASATDPSL